MLVVQQRVAVRTEWISILLLLGSLIRRGIADRHSLVLLAWATFLRSSMEEIALLQKRVWQLLPSRGREERWMIRIPH